MYIPDDKIEEIRAASDIVDVVSSYVQLKKSGSNFFGLCPFHQEKTPSFSVNPGMGIFKCFGCGVGGDAFQFVMRVEHVPFPDAVRLLAEQAGIDLPQEGQAPEEGSETESILHALRFAGRYFYDQLTSTDGGRHALEYLIDRGISKASIKKFGLGYAPDEWDALLTEAESHHVSAEVLAKAGLAIPRKSGDGHYDRFRGRVLFPIFSHVGKVVGFGGRILSSESDQPKYINSPETPVYHKSEVLYGLYHARRAVREQKEVYVVEGYTDVVALQQGGIENVVAACGTSLTPEHVRLLKRYCDAIIFLNDSDSAGDASNLRSVDLALKQSLTPYVVELPDGEDPASFVERHGVDELKKYLANPKYRWTFVQFHLIRARSLGMLDSVEGERHAFEDVLERIALIESRFAQETYLHQMAEALGKPAIHLHEEFARIEKRVRRSNRARQSVRDAPSPPPAPPVVPEDEAASRPVNEQEARVLPEERMLIRLMLECGRSIVEFVLGNMSLDEFSEGLVREVVSRLIEQYNEGAVDIRPFVNGSYGPAVQDLVTEALMDRHEPSANWQRLRNIEVPRMNQDPAEAAASAMTLLKLDRVDESIRRTKRRHDERQASGKEVRRELEDLMALRTLRKQIERREYLHWHNA